jgi:hypothetical protein
MTSWESLVVLGLVVEEVCNSLVALVAEQSGAGDGDGGFD